MKPSHNAIPSRDHLGTEFPSEAAMCRAHGVPQGVFRRRRSKGMSLEDALTLPNAPQAVPCTGPDGKEYPSMSAMCRANGLARPTVSSRMEKYAGNPEKITAGSIFETEDHHGKKFRSVKAMLREYGVKPHAYYERIRAGYTKEQALTAAPRTLGYAAAHDFDGTEFPSVTHMCRHWRVLPNAVRARISRTGCAPEDALRHVVESTWPGKTACGHEIRKCVRWPWFLCAGPGGNVLLRADRLRDMLGYGRRSKGEDGNAEET